MSDIAAALGLLKPLVGAIPTVGGILEGILDVSIEICERAEGVKSNREEMKELAERQAMIYETIVKVYKEKGNDSVNQASVPAPGVTTAAQQTVGEKDRKALDGLFKVLSDIRKFINEHQTTPEPRPKRKRSRAKMALRRVGHMAKEFLHVESVKGQIEQLRASLDRAVEAFGFVLNLQTADLVHDIHQLAGDMKPVLEHVAAEMSKVKEAVFTHKKDYDSEQNDKKRQKLIDWLRISNHASDKETLNRVTDITQPKSTCDWLFQHAQYHQWLEAGGLLWIEGIPGSGKTVLASAVIRTFLRCTVVYHYCAVKETNVMVDHVLRNLLVQLIEQLPAHIDLSDIEKQRRERAPLTRDTVLGLLKAISARAGECVTIVVDALDESNSHKDLALVLRLLAVESSLRLLATVRERHIKIPGDELSISLTTEAAFVNSSITQFVRSRMDDEDFLEGVKTDERNHIFNVLVHKARGMFRLVDLQLDQLKDCSDKAQRDQALRQLPMDLDAMYAQILTGLSGFAARTAKRALLWVFGAQTPLTLAQLVEALMIDENFELNQAWRVDQPENVLRACRSLVTYDKSTGRVMLSHATVFEYLSEHPAYLLVDSATVQLSDVHRRLALLCLRYLCLPAAGAGTSRDFGERCRNHPLVQYASFAWPKHVALLDSPDATKVDYADDPLFLFISKLVDNPDAGFHYCAYLHVTLANPFWGSAAASRSAEREPSWPTIVFCRQKWLVEGIFRLHPAWLSAYHPVYSTPLILAARHCFNDLVDVLVELGADVDQAVKVDDRDGTHSALYLAASRGLVKTCGVLLNRGADVNIRYEALETPLHVAALWGHAEVVNLLLQGGSVTRDIGNVHHATALHYAVSAAREDIVRKLLEYGFNPDARDDTGKVPMEIALRLHSPDVVQLLLSYRAQTTLLNLTVDDIEWARSHPWYTSLRSTLLRHNNCRLSVAAVKRLFRDLCSLGRGIPDSVIVTVLDMAELWVAISVSSSDSVQITTEDPELIYLRLSVRPGSRVRSVSFVMVSHDQGWSGEPELQGTYRGSFTWFDVGSSNPNLMPHCIQRNIHALSIARTHRITWDYSALTSVRHDWWLSLCAGQEIRLIPRAQFAGWVNYVQSAEIEILCVFDPALMA